MKVMQVLFFSYIFLGILLAILFLELRYRLIHRRNWLSFEFRVNQNSKNQENSQLLFERLLERKIPFALELFVHSLSEEIHLLISIEAKHKKVLSRISKSLWSNSKLIPFFERDLWIDSGQILRSFNLHQVNNPSLPIESLASPDRTLFKGLIAESSKLKVKESFSFQILVNPANLEAHQDKLNHLISRYNQSQASLLSPRLAKNIPLALLASSRIKAFESKSSHPALEADIKLVLSADSKNSLDRIQKDLEESLSQHNAGPKYNFLKLVRRINQDALIDDFQNYRRQNSNYFNSAELVQIFRFGSREELSPKIRH